ncbi:ubiquitin-like protein 4A [Eurytemora carolleeae]|uniref:ubiquitin-like protein 4A n=1 Tax=Eurytemora carolleeae TaxID=1294199 RepID=UPI000C787DF4|nr:ubiquitin-like protein 4A [Eurytemora carolleeae]|eukprot:XP_023321941.1 ubiquitin-like protein 4A [Eurytemora affinis]
MITVKILQGAECALEITEDNTTEDLKAGVERELKIPTENQKLVLKGKTLQDFTTLKEYKIKDGDKIFLVVKPGSVPAVPPTTVLDTPRSKLEAELHKILKDSFRSAEDCDKVVASFLRILERRISSLSLDDIERFCEHWKKEKSLQF